MLRKRTRPIAIGLIVALMLITTALVASASGPERGGTATYEVTIRNLTSGQPLTPPLLAIHNRPAGFFHVGRPASEGIQQLAENGNAAPIIAALESDPGVRTIFGGAAPLVPAGTPGSAMFDDEVTLTVEVPRRDRFLFYASMLICTNDGFTGVNALRLPAAGHSLTTYAGSYDAGSEINTEDFADLVPPCQGLIGVSSDDDGTGMSNPALAENGVVSAHLGIQGGDDLDPAVHGWDDPVVEITVVRTN